MIETIDILEENTSLRIDGEVKQAAYTYRIMISYQCLRSVPDAIFTNHEMAVSLRILDLSFNNIRALPAAIISLANLRELWLQSNPIQNFPSGMEKLQNLEVLDMRDTRVESIPPEFALLGKLHELDLRGTPVYETYQVMHNLNPDNIYKLKAFLNEILLRQNLEMSLKEYLMDKHFIEEADNPDLAVFVENLVSEISEMFTSLTDLKSFSKRIGTLLPDRTFKIDDFTLPTMKDKFYETERRVLRNRLSADVEIKLRAVYFDRIERASVEAVISSIYDHVESLEDIQFFIKYASQVLPPAPAQATGEVVWANIINLQAQLTEKRQVIDLTEYSLKKCNTIFSNRGVHIIYLFLFTLINTKAAIQGLATAMTSMYPEQKPEDILSKAREISAIFQLERFASKRELNNMNRMAADSSKMLPPDFPSIDPQEILQKMQSNRTTSLK